MSEVHKQFWFVRICRTKRQKNALKELCYFWSLKLPTPLLSSENLTTQEWVTPVLLNKTNFTCNLRLSTSYPNTEYTHSKQEFKPLLQWAFQCNTSEQHQFCVPSRGFCSLCTWTCSAQLCEPQQQWGLWRMPQAWDTSQLPVLTHTCTASKLMHSNTDINKCYCEQIPPYSQAHFPCLPGPKHHRAQQSTQQ